MRKICVAGLMSLILLLLENPSQAQTPIAARHLQITYSKTSSIIFPFAIKGVDRGSRDILLQKASGVENVLQLKAAKKNFLETNLTVITADGALYSFDVNYAADPKVLNLSFAEQPEKGVTFSDAEADEAQVRFDCQVIAAQDKGNVKKTDTRFGMNLQLGGLYIRGKVIYCRLLIENNTFIDYDIDQLRFFIRDQKKASRTASQELEIKPISVENKVDALSGQSSQVMVFALPKFTIPDKKYLAIQMMEAGGGRHLSLKINNRRLIRAKPVESIYME